MTKVNSNLMNSMLWNLREIVQLTAKIRLRTGDVPCLSWRFPIFSCNQVDVQKLLAEHVQQDRYLFVLELTYDRLLYIFHMVIKFLESTESLKHFKPQKNVKRPTTLSMAAVVSMIWDRLEAFNSCSATPAEGSKIEPQTLEFNMGDCSTMSTSSQSEVCSLTTCSACSMVQQFIFRLIEELEKIFQEESLDSEVLKERQKIKECMLETTNWAVMTRWLEAIIGDIKKVLHRIDKKKVVVSRKKKSKRESRVKTVVHNQETLLQFEEVNRNLSAKVVEKEGKIIKLIEDVEEIAKEKSRSDREAKKEITKLEEINAYLDRQLLAVRKEMSRIEKKHSQQLEKEKMSWDEKIAEATKKIQEETTRGDRYFALFNKQKVANEHLEKELNFLKEKSQSTKEDLENLHKENAILQNLLKEKRQKVDEYAARLLESYPELNQNKENKVKYKASGNPILDMMNQIEANNLRMESIKSENDKLKQTVERLWKAKSEV